MQDGHVEFTSLDVKLSCCSPPGAVVGGGVLTSPYPASAPYVHRGGAPL